MHLIPNLTDDGRLMLDAYSFDEREIQAVEITLRHSPARFRTEPLAQDRQGRAGRRFILDGAFVSPLQDFLAVRFSRQAGKTIVTFNQGGSAFRCEEIALSGPGSGCLNLTAQDADAATTKCALIANSKGWFGGVASPGTCS